ncbi:hypothetical protein ABPG77_004644, partial [Micractinium sp. CCAP 211/92]
VWQAGCRSPKDAGLLPLQQLLAALLALLVLAPAIARAQADNIITLPGDKALLIYGTAGVGILTIVPPVTVPNGTNPAIIVTLSPVGTRTGDVDLYCNPGSDPTVFATGQAEFASVALGVNQDRSLSKPMQHFKPIFACRFCDILLPLSSVQFRLEFATQRNYTGLAGKELTAAEELYNRCCQGANSCLPWKEGSQTAGVQLDADLCQFGSCDEGGALTALDVRGWNMSCPFPGDLFVQFPSLQRLYVSYNNFTGDINDAARTLSALRDLQEWAAAASNLTGTLDDNTPLCNMTQGVLELLAIDGNGINGTLPACLFNANSTLYQFSATENSLAGSIPDAFAGADRLQSFAVAGNGLTGTVPASLATAPGLVQVSLSLNNLSGPMPLFTSSSLTSLDMTFNQLTGAVPEAYAGHPSLNVLDLKGNQLVALPQKWSEPPAVDETSPLNYFRISFNRLEGGFPVALASYPNLNILSLNNNQLSGPLPDPQPDEFPALRGFNVAENEFNGTLGEGWEGTGIFQLEPLASNNLNTMNLTFNKLTGTVPAFFTDGAYPVNIYLDGNDFGVGNNSQPAEAADVSASPSNIAGASSGGGLSGGAIAGIVIGVIVAVGLACVAAFALVKRSRRRNFTEAGGNSSKFARFDDETTLPAAGLPVFTAAPSPDRTASLPQVELSPGGTARGTAPPDAPNPWAHS